MFVPLRIDDSGEYTGKRCREKADTEEKFGCYGYPGCSISRVSGALNIDTLALARFLFQTDDFLPPEN